MEAVIAELYGVRPSGFVAARGVLVARARTEGDAEAARAIERLRKPTLVVWAANHFARARPERAAALLRLGEQLRTAHRELDGAQLRALSHEQHRVTAALAREAGQVAAEAGERLSETALRDLGEVFHALLADEEGARTWAAGRLTAAPEAHVGFEGLGPGPGAGGAGSPPAERRTKGPGAGDRRAAEAAGLGGGEAAEGTRPKGAAAAGTTRTTKAAEAARAKAAKAAEAARVKAAEAAEAARLEAAAEAVARARAAAEEAAAELDGIRTEAEAAAEELDRARAEAETLRAEIQGLRPRLDSAEQAARTARTRHDQALRARTKAERAAETAARALREAEARTG